jgi:FAD/FMN-containing dehydrogenase
MSLTVTQLSEIRKLLSEEETIEPSSPPHAQETRAWASQKQQNPSVVIRPRSILSLQTTLQYLCNSTLDFSIRSSELGSSSAKDAVVSMSTFSEVVFNPEDETVLVGAGQTWGEVDRKLADVAPGYVGMLPMLYAADLI